MLGVFFAKSIDPENIMISNEKLSNMLIPEVESLEVEGPLNNCNWGERKLAICHNYYKYFGRLRWVSRGFSGSADINSLNHIDYLS